MGEGAVPLARKKTKSLPSRALHAGVKIGNQTSRQPASAGCRLHVRDQIRSAVRTQRSMAAVATTAARTTSTTTGPAAAPTTTATAGGALLSLVHPQRASAHRVPIQVLDSAGSVCIAHLD